jgi:clan AA aspartic protease
MMAGMVNAVLEAALLLDIHGLTSQTTEPAVIDTGYNGALTLPLSVIVFLALTPLGSRSVTLGDASQRVLDFYEAEVEWDGPRKNISVLCVEGDPLFGTTLLKGYKMEADLVEGGQIRIIAIP